MILWIKCMQTTLMLINYCKKKKKKSLNKSLKIMKNYKKMFKIKNSKNQLHLHREIIMKSNKINSNKNNPTNNKNKQKFKKNNNNNEHEHIFIKDLCN